MLRKLLTRTEVQAEVDNLRALVDEWQARTGDLRDCMTEVTAADFAEPIRAIIDRLEGP